MLNSRNTLLVCLPLFVVLGCQGKSKKHNDTPPVISVVTTPTQTTNPGTGSDSTANPGQSDNTNQSGDQANQSDGTNQSGVDTNKPECETLVLDFDKKPDGSDFQKGEKITGQYKAYGVSISSHQRLPNGELKYDVTPILFDTAERPSKEALREYKMVDCKFGNCDGFDWDLTTESNGKALIIAEHMFDINPFDNIDLVTYPDDNDNGGMIKLVFDKPTSLVSLDLIDVEKEGSFLDLYTRNSDGTYSLKTTQPVPAKGDGEAQMLSVDDHSYVDKLLINLSRTGAVDNIKICVKN